MKAGNAESGNSKEAHDTLKALAKTRQHKSAAFEDSGGNILMKSTAVLNRWTEYCSGLNKLHLETLSYSRVNRPPTQSAESVLVLREEVENKIKFIVLIQITRKFGCDVTQQINTLIGHKPHTYTHRP